MKRPLRGRSLHDGYPAAIRLRFAGGTGADAAIYSTTVSPKDLREQDRVVAFLLPTADPKVWRLAGFHLVHHVVEKPTGPVVLGDESHQFLTRNQKLADAEALVVATAGQLGVK